MRRAIEYISNIRIRILLLNHLNISANRTTELFTQHFIYDRSSCHLEVVKLPYVNPSNMAFVFAPITVCEELAEVLLACDEEERVRLLSEASDDNEHVLAKIMRNAPEKTRRKITTSIKALSDDNKCILLLGSRNGFISTKFVSLLNHKDTVASVDLIEALRVIERNRLLKILSQDSNPLFKSYDGIIDILQSNPPENIALAVLSLLDNENDINLKKLFFGSSKMWFINSINLVHVTLINKSDLVILKLFSLLKRLNLLDINQLFTHRACFFYKSGRYTHRTPDPLSNAYGDTPLTWAFEQPNNTNATALIIQELSKLGILRLYKVHTLLFGPPGGGKTEFARLVVEKSNCPCFIVDPGNSVTALVNAFSQARACEKALIFIDEFDHFASTPTGAQRIQTEMDGFVKSKNTLVVIGATNYLENIMPPVLSRFGNKIEVLLPNQEQRSLFFKFSLTNLRINSPKAFDTSLDEEISNGCINLGRKTEHFSIRDLYAVLNQITPTLVKRADGPTKDNLEPLMAILERVISKVKKAVDKEHLLPFASAANSPVFFSPISMGLVKNSPDLIVSHKLHK